MARPRAFDEHLVLSRAMETFWEQGYHGTSPADLAQATGIAKGSLYNAFTSKRALFERCLELYQEQITELARALMERPGTTHDALGEALRAVVDADRDHPRGCLIGNTATELAGAEPDLARTLRRMQDESTGWFAARIARGQDEGDVSADLDSAAFANFLATTLAGLRVLAMTHDTPTLYRVIDTALVPLQPPGNLGDAR